MYLSLISLLKLNFGLKNIKITKNLVNFGYKEEILRTKAREASTRIEMPDETCIFTGLS